MSCIGNSRQAETASLPNAEVCQVVVKHPFMFSLCPSVKYILHFTFCASNEVPNLGLGPNWDQSPEMVPKKCQFCKSQISPL